MRDSDAWKIVQGLKRGSQNNSFGGSNNYRGLEDPMYFKNREKRKLTKKELRDKKWKEIPTEILFQKGEESKSIEEIREYLQEYKRKKGKFPDEIKIGEMRISINPKDSNIITFSSTGSRPFDNLLKYPYSVTINGDDIYSEVDVIDDNIGLKATFKEEGDSIVSVSTYHYVSIIDAEEANESFSLSSEGEKTKLQYITEKLLECNPEFKSGTKYEIYRENIQLEEKIKRFASESKEYISVKGYVPTCLDGLYESYSNYLENKRMNIRDKEISTYGEYIPIAKEIEEHCKYMYSLFMEAYKERPKETKRLQKVEKAKELAALSKKQDIIISELESQKQAKGVDFGEQ
mgnify:CR=1 FL=1